MSAPSVSEAGSVTSNIQKCEHGHLFVDRDAGNRCPKCGSFSVSISLPSVSDKAREDSGTPDWDGLIVEHGEAVWSVENWQKSGCSSLGEAIRAREFARTALRSAIASLESENRRLTAYIASVESERDEAVDGTSTMAAAALALADLQSGALARANAKIAAMQRENEAMRAIVTGADADGAVCGCKVCTSNRAALPQPTEEPR